MQRKGVNLIPYELTPLQVALEKLPLPMQSGFKLLYSFGFSLKQEPVFFVRQSYQINWSIIVSDSVQMVDNPAFRQGLVMCSFPYQNVFSNIAIRVSSWMTWLINENIASTLFITSTFPRRMFVTGIRFKFSRLPKSFHAFTARRAVSTFRSSGAHWLTTNWARCSLLPFLILQFIITLMGATNMSVTLRQEFGATDNAICTLFHTIIILGGVKQCQ